MDKITQVVNSKTGELFDVAVPVIPFRTLLTASEYQDSEQYEPDSSMTDLTGYEPLESIVARCMRTMKSPSGVVTQVLDVNALKAEAHDTGIYEAGKASTVDEAFETLDPTDAPGFDFVDGSRILQSVNDNISTKAKELSTTSTKEQAPKSQATEDNAVENSDNVSEMFEEKADKQSA